MKQSLRIGVFALWALGLPALAADLWTFDPPRMGRVLQGGDGAWVVDYTLGSLSAGAEFSFPLQLVYLNQRDNRGLFGPHWFCPQLESTVLPREHGVLVWTQPSGAEIALQADEKRVGEYSGADGSWRARGNSEHWVLAGEDGWEFTYRQGRLQTALSPTRRALDYVWEGTTLRSLQVRDALTGNGSSRTVAAFATGEQHRLTSINMAGQRQTFVYATNLQSRLQVWQPATGRPLRFSYETATGGLNAIERGPSNRVHFVTARAPAAEEQKGKPVHRSPTGAWLIQDERFTYEYGRDRNTKVWTTDQVTLRTPGGREIQYTCTLNRGIVSVRENGVDLKSFYYRAPGRRYDGRLRRIEENGRVLVEYRYDRRTGLLEEATDGDGTVTTFDYPEKAGHVPFMRGQSGAAAMWPQPVRVRRGSRRDETVVAGLVYDDVGHVLAVTNALGAVTRYGYAAHGDLQKITDALGGETVLETDALGRLFAVTRGGLRASVAYDALGRVESTTEADGSQRVYGYDQAGRLGTIRQNGHVVLEYVRDADGEVVAERDALGRAHSIDRDARGNLQADIAPNGAITRYEYDAQDQRTAQIDGNGNRILFAYDAFNRLEGQTDALGNGLHWQYDNHGRLVQRLNGEQTVRSFYDRVGRPTRTAYGPPAEVVETKWDREGHVQATSTPVAACEFSRDKLGRVEAIDLKGWGGAEEQVLRFRFDALGRRTGLLLARQTAGDAYAALQQTEQVFDPEGRLQALLDDGRPAIGYGYDKAGRLTRKTFGNGMTADIRYDPMGRLARMDYTGGPLKAPLRLTYEWDLAGQLTRRGWNGAVQRYEYDPSGQLLKVLDDASGAELEAYVYDPAGNMLEKQVGGDVTRMTYNAANQLVSARNLTTASGYRYDRAGRLTAESVTNLAVGANGILTTRSTYGWLDKLIRLERVDGVRVQYQYWPDGQLAAKIPELIPGAPALPVERFLWDGLALLRRNDTVYVVEPHASGGVPVASHPAGQAGPLTWYLNDLLGTTLATIEGDRVALRPLTAFGQPLRQKTDLAPPGDLKPAAPPTFLPKS